MNKMKTPKKVRIAAYTIDILIMSSEESECRKIFGNFSNIELIIRLANNMPVTRLLDTFIHEITHAIFRVYNIHGGLDSEERIVTTLATAWVQIYRDNPEVLEFIQNCTKDIADE